MGGARGSEACLVPSGWFVLGVVVPWPRGGVCGIHACERRVATARGGGVCALHMTISGEEQGGGGGEKQGGGGSKGGRVACWRTRRLHVSDVEDR